MPLVEGTCDGKLAPRVVMDFHGKVRAAPPHTARALAAVLVAGPASPWPRRPLQIVVCLHEGFAGAMGAQTRSDVEGVLRDAKLKAPPNL